ncbi:MAG: helix-turn-helix domain-containing protein [Christensenellales bacterium]
MSGSLEDRIEIMECLCKRMSFKAISRRIAKYPTIVSKEVKLHAKSYSSGFTRTQDVYSK